VNIQEYIASGILETYVLGELSPREEQEVLSMADRHAEIRKELDRIEETLEQTARHRAVKAPEPVKKKLLDALDKTGKDGNIISLSSNKKRPDLYKYVAAASILIAVFASVLAFNYWSNWQNTEAELNTLITQNQQIADNYNQVNDQLGQLKRDVSILNDSSFVRIPMPGTSNSPDSYATVYWDEVSEKVYLSILKLEKLSDQQQYQLWAIIDGVPVDAGVFNLAEGLIQLNNVPKGATAFAVTVEPAGGSEEPTMETMKVLGTVSRG